MGDYPWNKVGSYAGPIRLGTDMGTAVDVEFYRGGIKNTYGWAHNKKGHDAPINPTDFGKLGVTDEKILAMLQQMIQVKEKIVVTPQQISQNNPDLVSLVRRQLK